MKKKIVNVLLCVGISTMLFCGCGTVKDAVVSSSESIEQTIVSEETDDSQDASVEEKDEVAAGAEESAVVDAEASKEEEQTAEEQTAEEQTQEKQPKVEFVADRSETFALLDGITSGWNLGNTFDARGAGDSLSSETYWGNPKTTADMIDAISEKGFNTIRIPITWAEHVGSAPDYKINEEWLNRIKEVVDYCYADNMYVIIDTHHEPDFWMTADPTKTVDVKAELMAIWTQVAEFFKDYDEHLMFEGMNENRVIGSENEWNGGTEEERGSINELNQGFIDAVRKTGGNNETRTLILSTYGNSASYLALKDFVIPEDNHIALAVHMYTPYYFTYEADGGFDNWDGSQKQDIISALKLLKKYFISKDMPVIVTEYGAVNKNNDAEVLKWVEDYIGSMENFGIKCIWWDNGIYDANGEKFALFNRSNCSWYREDIADKIISLTK